MVIVVKDLRLSLAGRPVLNSVNLCMGQGDIYGLLGPNGAGKSVTMSVLTGLRRAESGTVSVLGLDPAKQTARLHQVIGVMPEQSGLYGWMNAEGFLRWFSALYGMPLAPDKAKERLGMVGLEGAAGQPIETFSRGMRQRLGLARALVNHPQLLILDEPTNGLDPRGRLEIHNILLNLAQAYGVGILMCTHLLDDVDRLCTRVGIIHHGETVLEGGLAALLATRTTGTRYRIRLAAIEPKLKLPMDVRIIGAEGQWMFVEITGSRPASELWARMFAQGWNILEIHAEAHALEQLYLSATQENTG